MQLSSMSLAYPAVGGAARAELTRRLLASGPTEDVFVLSTCLRIELAVSGGSEDLNRALEEVFGADAPLEEGTRRTGDEAAQHLFRVAAGLESPILGEQEILTQFRQAVIAGEEVGTIRGLFAKLLETAVSTGRQARDLLPGSPHASMAAVAAQMVGGHDRVAVLGSGLMSTAVVMGLFGLPVPPEVVVVARAPEKVSIEGIEVWPFERAGEALASFSAVVSATSAKRRPISDEDLEVALRDRKDRLMLVDMAMPPDFACPPDAPVDYVDIDLLARMADRRTRSEDADEMVAIAATEAYRRVTDHHALGPVIGGLTRTADDVVERTVDRFAGRLSVESDREVLRQTAHTVARTLLSDAIEYLRSADRPDEAVDIIADAFGIEGE